jgi:RecA-family ATPase
MSALRIPEISPDSDALTAALAYADAGFYVVPVKRGTKHPGSILGNGWHSRSTRDPQRIAAWFAGTDHGVALHCGRSGAVVIDVDHPDQLPDVLRRNLDTAPYQSTRPDTVGRGHYVFTTPPGRTLGNSPGKLGKAWGEVRGLNGVIIAEPTPHPEGGMYRWDRTGPAPVLPDEIAEQLDDTTPAEDAASDTAVKVFLAEHTSATRPTILAGWRNALQTHFETGSRHNGAVSVLTGALKEARAGFFPATAAVELLRPMFITAAVRPPTGGERQRNEAVALDEWQGILAWAVAQAKAADLREVLDRTEAKMPPGATDWVEAIGQPTETQAHSPQIALTTLADVQPERVSWLWPGRIPAGKLVTLDGDPGLGKSTLAISLAAPITTGGDWPDGSTCAYPGAVLLMSAEDGLADTTRPRCDAAGADVTKVHSIDGVPLDDEGTLRPPTLADVAGLEEAITDTHARLLVIDVVMAYLPTGTDSHKDQDIRRVLSRLAALADRTGCTILLIRHLNKAKGGDPLYRGGGSIGIVGAARAGLLVAPDPDDEDRRVLASVKSNLCPAPESLAYRLVGEGEFGVARVQWEGQTQHTARSLLAAHDGDDEDRREVDHWLTAYLEEDTGAANARDVIRDGKLAGFSEDVIKKARKRMKLQTNRHGFGKGSTVVWSIGARIDAIEAGTQNPVPMAPVTAPMENGSPAKVPPTGAPTAQTPGMTDRVMRAIANASGANGKQPECTVCGKPVVAGQGSRHFSCDPDRAAS